MSTPEEARAAVLARIRSALGIAKLDRARRAAVARRLERHPRGTIAVQALLGPAACVSRLAEIDAARIGEAPAREVMIIDRDDLPAASAWSETLVRGGVRTRYVALPGFVKMMMTPPQFAQVPETMVQAAREWLLDYGGARARTSVVELVQV